MGCSLLFEATRIAFGEKGSTAEDTVVRLRGVGSPSRTLSDQTSTLPAF